MFFFEEFGKIYFFKKINFLISGESDFVLNEIANNFNNTAELEKINGVSFIKNNQLKINKRQKIISNFKKNNIQKYVIYFQDQKCDARRRLAALT